MLSVTKFSQRARWCVGFIVMAVTPLAFAAMDRIETPSHLSGRAAEGLLLDIAHAGDRLVAVGDQGRILLSDDQGVSWKQVQAPVSVLLTSVYFSDAQHGWAVGHDGVVIHTEDAGDTWLTQLNGRQLNQLQLDTYQTLVDAGGDPQAQDLPMDELELFLEDAMVAVEEGPTQPLLDVLFVNNQLGFLLGSYGVLLKTEDAGVHWSVLSHRLPNPGRFHLNALLVEKQSLIIAGEAGVLFKSDDMGDSWIALESPYEGSFFGLLSYAGQGQALSQVLALGLRGHLFASEDSGDSWQQIAVDSTASLVSAASNNNEVMLVGQGGLVLTGKTLDKLTAFEPQDRRAWSAVTRVNDGWVLVGEKGIKRISDTALGADHE
ncbi:WD40/YVTN/BNR-like repeat-containing protein [Neptunomonas antarctica]|nr:YCF48-related protein [Neptunomonas antarctica]